MLHNAIKEIIHLRPFRECIVQKLVGTLGKGSREQPRVRYHVLTPILSCEKKRTPLESVYYALQLENAG